MLVCLKILTSGCANKQIESNVFRAGLQKVSHGVILEKTRSEGIAS